MNIAPVEKPERYSSIFAQETELTEDIRRELMGEITEQKKRIRNLKKEIFKKEELIRGILNGTITNIIEDYILISKKDTPIQIKLPYTTIKNCEIYRHSGTWNKLKFCVRYMFWRRIA